MKLLSLFSGIGAFEKALDRLNINYELVGFSEIDKYAVKSYCAIHGVEESKNLGDITKIDEKALPKDIDLVTYGFPCQDISLAGKQQGLFNDDGTQTRSGLFFEALRIIEEANPIVAIAENVKNLTSKKFSEQFNIVLDSLEQAGYNNYWQVLNAKDYGIPQSRERVFIVSIRKDVDTGCFKFPEGFPSELRLKDLLEDEVDEKYYLSEKAVAGFNRHKERHIEKGNGFGWNPTDGNVIANTLLASGAVRPSDNFIEEPQVKQIGNCFPTKTRENPNQGRIYDTEGLAPCLNQMGGGNRQPFVTVREATKKGYAEAYEGDSINLEQPNSKTRRGRVGHGVAQTLTTSPQQGAVMDNLKIRKLTPKECFRLMNFDDSDYEKAEKVNSNTQLYKQAGNSIVVAVPYYIIKALIEANIFIDKEKKEMELKINDYQLPKIDFNFEELKQEVEKTISEYASVVYSGDQMKEAKQDVAKLRKFVKAMSDERIRIKKDYMKPCDEFESKVKELTGIVDNAISSIDTQIKTFEEKQKEEKKQKIKEYWAEQTQPSFLTFEQIFNEKWLNASVSMKSIQEEINVRLEQISNDLVTLSNLPEFGFEATEVYKTTLDVNKSITEAHRMSEMAKAKAAHEAEMKAKQEELERLAAEAKANKVEPKPQPAPEGFMNTPAEEAPKKMWVSFKALLSKDDALALKEFFESRKIELQPI